MPTSLREQLVGEQWVYPVLEEVAGTLRVTLILPVGTIADEEIVEIAAETLDARLTDRSGRQLEPQERPPAGPLPVRGGPSLQSTATFTFALAERELATLEVRLGEERATFGAGDRRGEGLAGFTGPAPPAGADFPVRSPPANVLERILAAILHFLKGVGRFIKNIFSSDRCCLVSFNAPANLGKVGRRATFDMEADFASRGEDCACKCCEYRQFVRGAFTVAGVRLAFQLPDGLLDPNEYREDGVPRSRTGLDEDIFYGHRDQRFRSPFDQYTLPGREDGCRYRGHDEPRCPPPEQLHAEFIGLIVDVCQGRVVAASSWIVDLP